MKCIICNYNDIGEFGHNAEPVKEGRCCSWCNNNFVMPKRIEALILDKVTNKDDKPCS